MASSSLSSMHPVKYDVFLSFRGADTRNNFTSHLHSALIRQGIVTFIDDRLERGEEIEAAILKAIQESHISIVILSKNYAASAWCLDELVKIFECRDAEGHKVIPVFYHVDLTDTGSFGEELAMHDNMDKVGTWRNVLRSAANLSGVVIDGSRPESELIGDIVNQTLKYLWNHHYHSDEDFKNLVGLQPRVSEVESLLCIGSNDVRIIGIWGMGGIGKTTIAKFVYKKYASRFDSTCCLENVRDHNLYQLQDELLFQLLSEGSTTSRLRFQMTQLRHKKLLIVLDNVDEYEQIELLAGAHNWFGKGSRIIITSRDKSVFQNVVDGIYEVEALTDEEALLLFSLYAFKENRYQRNHRELSNKVISYAGGNPLALKVLGLFFYNKSEEEQRSALKKLEKVPDKKIQNVLKISYDGLDYHEKQIFLHIACFFKGESISKVVDLLDACGSFTLIGLRVLADKSLIITSNGKVDMHDLLQELGRQIVRQESTEPGKRTRLWDHEEIYHVFMKNTGTDAVESICLDKSKLEMISLSPKVFDTMNGIKLFKFYNSDINRYSSKYVREENVSSNVLIHANNMVFPEGIEYLPNELRYFQWHFYPVNSLPSNFLPGKLVELDLYGSSVETLWEGVQDLPNLKVIKVRSCKRLSKLPCLSKAPNVKIIDCSECKSLAEVCPSISCLNNLQELVLTGCKKVESVPDTKCLRFLDLSSSGIDRFPQVPTTIEILTLGRTNIEEIPCSIQLLSHLKGLSLFRCPRVKNIPDFVFQLKHLEALVYGPSQFNNNICLLSSLRSLYLTENELESIPACIQQLSCLQDLNLSFCTRLRSLPKLPPSLLQLNTSQCTSLKLVSTSLFGLEEDWGIFFFVNCTSLNQNELRSILIYSQRRILNLAHAASKNKEVLKASIHNVFGEYDGQFVVVIPENIIPNWISHQSIGFSITIPLPPNWFHGFLGFVVGTIFDFGSVQTNNCGNTYFMKHMRLEIDFKSNCDEASHCIMVAFHYFDYSIGSQYETTNSPAEQLLLWYHKDFSFTYKEDQSDSMCQYKEVTFKIFIEDYQHKPLSSSLIKKCGVRILYNGDKDEQEEAKSLAITARKRR